MDIFVRVFHWSLVVAVPVAALTGFLLGASWIETHIWAGGVGAGLIFVRIAWGFWGTSYERFSSFVLGPHGVLDHLREFHKKDASRHPGHNPLGALMILAIMGFVLGGVFKAGPFRFAFSSDSGRDFRNYTKCLP